MSTSFKRHSVIEHDRRKIRVDSVCRQIFLLQTVNIIINMLSTFIFGFAVEIAAAIGNDFFIISHERFTGHIVVMQKWRNAVQDT